MRRLFTFLTAIVLVLVSVGIGTFTADLPFWRRAMDLPLAAGQSYLPVVQAGGAPMGAVEGVDPAQNSIDSSALEAVAASARANGAEAVLVMHRGHLQLERYFDGSDTDAAAQAWQLRPADFLARPLAALAVGLAVADQSIRSLDDPVATYFPEWEGDRRGAITVRQLLQETSGLEPGVDTAATLGAHPFADWSRLPAFATSRGVRLLLGNDFAGAALNFRLEHEPGGFFEISPANTQLAAVLVERATGVPYEEYLGRRLLGPAGMASMEMMLDRRSGMPAAHCCLRARARDVLALAELLRLDGEHPLKSAGGRVLPPGWVTEITRGSRPNPEFGLQIERLMPGAQEIWRAGSGQGGGMWIARAAELTVVVLAHRDVPTADALVLPLLRALRK